MVSRSTDLGSTWSPPEAVVPSAIDDGATDVSLAMAADLDGNYLLAWNTNRGDLGRLAGPSTVVATLSADSGLSWSPPFHANTDSPVDGLRILRRSVDLPDSCPGWTCDANGTGNISVADSALVLRKSVGMGVSTNCHERIVVHAEASEPLSSVQFTMDYSRALGKLTDEAGKLSCRWLVPGGIYAFADIDRV